MLLDSNIIIYAVQNDAPDLLELVRDPESFASIVSYIEVLGYHALKEEDRQTFERIFETIELLDLTPEVAEQATTLRQQRRMGLGDAIIAATALVHNQTLLTRNTRDFRQITNLRLIDPIADDSKIEH